MSVWSAALDLQNFTHCFSSGLISLSTTDCGAMGKLSGKVQIPMLVHVSVWVFFTYIVAYVSHLLSACMLLRENMHTLMWVKFRSRAVWELEGSF